MKKEDPEHSYTIAQKHPIIKQRNIRIRDNRKREGSGKTNQH